MWFYVAKSGFMSAILDVRNSLSIAFLATSDRYATLILFLKFLTKWLPSVILDVRNSLSIVFLAISDRLAILDFLNSLSIAILAISDRYRILLFFSAAILDVRRSHFWPFLIDRPYWMSKIHFRWHFWPFQIHTDLNSFFKFWTKWPLAATLDVRK